MELEKSLDVEEFAEVTGVPVPSVYEGVKLGLIPHYQLGKHIRFVPQVIRNWMENGGTKAAAARLQARYLYENTVPAPGPTKTHHYVPLT
jgi:excisionase family DNA binding protein